MKRALCLLLVFAMLMPNFTLFVSAEETQPAAEETVAIVSETTEMIATTAETTVETTVVTESVEETTAETEPMVETTVVTEPVVETTVATEPVVETTEAMEPVVETTEATEPIAETEVTAPAETEAAAMEQVQTFSITEEANGSYRFETLADLQELASRDYSGDNMVTLTYGGSEDLVISGDLTLPDNTQLWVPSRNLVVSEGVSLDLYSLEVDYLTVNGTLSLRHSGNVRSGLTITGAITGTSIGINSGFDVVGLDKITADTYFYWSANSLETFLAGVSGANENPKITYFIDVEQPIEISEAVTLPKNAQLNVNNDLVIAEEGSFTLHSYTQISGDVTVYGAWSGYASLNITGDGHLAVEAGGSFAQNGNFSVNSGESRTSVEDAISGVDLTQWRVVEEEWGWDLQSGDSSDDGEGDIGEPEEDQTEIWQDGDNIYFYTFEQLQQIASGTYTNLTDACYEGTEDLVITEDLTLPENLVLSLWGNDANLVVAEGAALYNSKRIFAHYMTVNGTVYSTGDIHVKNALTVNGAMHMDNGDLSFYDETVFTDRDKVTFTQESDGIHKSVYIQSASKLAAAVETVNTETDALVTYDMSIQEPIVLEQSLTISGNCSVNTNDYAPITVAAGCTLTMDVYFPIQCAVIVEGTIVNNQEFGVHENGSITFQGEGSYSGEGLLWVSNSNIADPSEVLTGFDFTGYEAKKISSDYWEIRDVGGLIKLADPTDLQWGTYYQAQNWNEETQEWVYEAKTLPGAWAVKFGDPYQGEMIVNIYREGSEGAIATWGCSVSSPYQWYSEWLLCQTDLESGNYYFTAVVEGDYETYYSSNVVTSPVYTYTKPEAQLGQCSNLTWDGRNTSYTAPADTTYVDGYEIKVSYAQTEGGELQYVTEWGVRDGSDPACMTIGGWITDNYGAGYYYYQVRALSSDIEMSCNGTYGDLSTPYYYDGSVWTEPEIPETTEPAPTEPEETGGTCGENVNWTLDEETGLLHIFGSGDMYDYNPGDNPAPWAYKNITAVQIDAGVTSIGKFAFFCGHSLQSVQIADSVTSIGIDAFHCCCSLTEISLPKNLTTLGSAAFLACRELKTFQISEDNTAFKTMDGVLFTKNGKTLIAYPAGNTRTSYTVPAGVTTIEEVAFSGSIHLKSVTLPDSVTEIRRDGFYSCFALESIQLGKNLKTIGNWAFNSCESLKEITIPAGVTQIGYLAFGHCAAMSKITFQGNAPEMKETGTGDGEGGTFFNVTAKVYYPVAANGWSTAKKNYGGVLTWVAYGDLKVPTVKVTNRASDGKPSLSWNAVEGATEYQVWSSKTGKADSFDRLITVSKTSHVHAKAVTGSKYYYKIRAVGADGVQSDFSNVVSRKSDLAQPKIEAFARADNGKIKINWDKVEGAVKYQVYRSAAKDGDYTLVKTTTDRSYADNNVSVNKLYYYKVRAVYSDTDCNSAYSEIDSARCILPRTEITLSTVDASGKVKISWKKIDGAAKYEVYRSTKKDSGYSKIATTTKLNATDTSGAAGTTYYYKVKAIHSNANASSAYSVAKSRLVKLAQPVVKATNIADSGKIHLSWDKVDGATKYQIYRATSKTGTYKLMWTVTGTGYNNLFQIDVGKTYYYKVKAICGNADANSIFSEIVSRTCKLEQPEVTVRVVRFDDTTDKALSENRMKLTWKKVTDAKAYYIVRATSKNGTYQEVGTFTKTSFTDENVGPNETYYYKVMALYNTNVNKNTDVRSAYSEPKGQFCKAAYPNVRYCDSDASSGKTVLRWNEVNPGEPKTGVRAGIRYDIYRATSKSGTYSKIGSVTKKNTSTREYHYTDSSATIGKTYYYKIKAVYLDKNGKEVSKASSDFTPVRESVRTLPRPDVKVDYKGGKKLTWEKVTGATKYQIYRCKEKYGTYKWAYTTTKTKYTILNTSDKYYYKVRAIYKDSAGNSAFTNPIK